MSRGTRGEETRVRVHIQGRADATEVSVHHSGFAEKGSAAPHEAGWAEFLEGLGERLKGGLPAG